MKKAYINPTAQSIPLLPNVLQTLSTKVDSGGATTGGRANEQNFSWDDNAWDYSEEEEK